MPSSGPMRFFATAVDAAGVARVTWDHPGSRWNLWTPAVAAELDDCLRELSTRENLRAVVLLSGKEAGFSPGEDLDAIRSILDGREAARQARRGQEAIERLAGLRVPTVAAIHGPCLGAGLELALACRYRVATRDPRTRFGLPQAGLGLVPSQGGTVRLPEILGLRKALPLLLEGQEITVQEALRVGLVDAMVPVTHLDGEAYRLAIRRSRPSRVGRFSSWPIVRSVPLAIAGGRARRAALRYPAQPTLLRTVATGLRKGRTAGLEAEAAALEELLPGPAARSLLALAWSREDARKLAAEASRDVPPVRRALLVGAGVMGRQVATLMAGCGVGVRLREVDPLALASALGEARAVFAERVRSGRITPEEGRDATDLVTGGLDAAGTRAADLVLENVPEDLELKRTVLREAETRIAPDAVLATDTSSFRVAELARGLSHPGRMIGLHFFNPVDRMGLVEVVRGPETTDEAAGRALGLVLRLGKVPILVRDGPGFLVNRLLGVYVSHALGILWWGARPEAVDEALERFGWPMGPLRLIDLLGVETVHRVTEILHLAYPERIRRPVLLEGLLKQGRTGRKAGAGIYDYERGRRVARIAPLRRAGWREGSTPPADQIVARTLYPMVDEANRCLEEGTVGNVRQVDLAVVLGAGFPAWRGGLLRWADSVGAPEILRAWEGWGAAEGVAYAPSEGLRERARQGAGFYGAG